AVLAVASVAKFGGAYAGGTLAKLPAAERVALGVGLNARGALEIVIATVGLGLGVLNARVYTVIVLMAIVTSAAAPPLLRLLARGWAGTPEEQERLQREETMNASILVRPSRFLVPVAGGDGSALAAKILDLAWPQDQEATVVALDPTGEGAMERVAALLERRPVTRETLEGEDPVRAVIEHAALGYGIVGMGAWQASRGPELLSPLAEGVLRETTLPVLVVWPGVRARVEAVTGFRRILVPALATAPSRAAQELAFNLAASAGAEVLITHVATPRQPALAGRPGTATPAGGSEGGRRMAQAIVSSSAQTARRMGIRPRAVVRIAGSRREEITRLIEEHDIDLVVLSAELQQVDGAVFLGSLVEDLIAATRTTVAMVAAPADWLAPGKPA
ncbi:MAG TPA: universal stress protein, partial [Acidimicrobiales bacterium]